MKLCFTSNLDVPKLISINEEVTRDAKSSFLKLSLSFPFYNVVGGFLCGEKKERDLEIYTPVFFWTVWKERNHIAFRTLSVQRLKHSFITYL